MIPYLVLSRSAQLLSQFTRERHGDKETRCIRIKRGIVCTQTRVITHWDTGRETKTSLRVVANDQHL